MKLHSIFKDKSLIKEHVPFTDLFQHIPPGARFVSGNTVRTERDPKTGQYVEIHETKAVYKCREGGHITILQES